jgi:uncharacterized protein
MIEPFHWILPMTTSGQIRAPVAIAFETGLIAFAATLGWLLGRWPLPGVSLETDRWFEQLVAVGWGGLAAIPLILIILLLDRFPFGPWRSLQRTVDQRLLPMIRHWTVLDMLLISLAAGLGEEMLFRGLFQAGLIDWLPGTRGVVIGLVAASAVFGMCHWVSHTYAVLAGGMGLYLGVVLLFTENLLAPIVTHAVYDFAALLYLLRYRPATDVSPHDEA